jgi:hypothetical protein
MANASQLNARVPSSAESLLGRVIPNRLTVNDDNRKQPIGAGIKNEPLVFPAGKSTGFQLEFLVKYSPNKKYGNAVNDPALNEIIQLCVEAPLIPGSDRSTTIRYETKADIAALRFLGGLVPNPSGELKIKCPLQGAAREALISSITAGNGRTGTPKPLTSGRSLTQKKFSKHDTNISIPATLAKDFIIG